MDLSLPLKETLRDGLSPRLRFLPFEVDRFQEDGTLWEEFARDVPHVGHSLQDRPMESFCISRDVYAGYFFAIWPLMKAQISPFGLLEHSHLQILIKVISILYRSNSGHPRLIVWMLRLTKDGTPPIAMSGVRIVGLIPFDSKWIVLLVHLNPKNLQM